MTKVKICGLSTKEAVDAAVDYGADYLGFVFAKSKRQVDVKKVKRISKDVPSHIKKVGVFVSPSMSDLLETIHLAKLDMVQIHGQWDEKKMTTLPVPVIKAYNLTKGAFSFETMASYLLLDAAISGSGEAFDWEIVKNVRLETPYFLAGGLTPETVGEAIRLLKPYAVDVSSGVETNGQKDLTKIRLFIESVKNNV